MNYFLKTTGLSLLCSMMLTTGVKANNPVEYVNPLVGSESTFELSTGNTYPIIAMPWGMNFWTPQTGKMGDGWTYSYTATKIRGLKQTHQPSPWINDYGCFALMPITGAPVFDETKRASWFSHKAETAKPYYYSVYLADYDVTAEVVPTERAALFRLTFPKSDSSFVVIDAYDRGSSVTILPEQRKIIGYTTRNSGGVPDNFKNYFVMEFDHPFTYTYAVSDGRLDSHATTATCNHAGAIVGFSTRRGEKVHVRVASSFISPEQAERNLNELGDANFDRLVAKGQQRWNDILNRIEVNDDNTDHLRTFYSCCSPASCSSTAPTASPSTTAPTTVRCCRAACTPTPASGTPSARSSHCST